MSFSNPDNALEKVIWEAPLPVGFVAPTPEEVDAAIGRLTNPVPMEIANWKGHAVLVARGLHDQVAAALAAIPDAAQRALAQTAFDRADFLRSSPLLISILTDLGLSAADIDRLFRDGNALSL